ncbi:MarR family transcriptional regulator [Novosphingobium flavum]|uniref:MarR family transcriptional regulator n=1 Tax=Novosphingobium aerophilum TaxID=2839843 RepID=A0A7X1F738_9SPHN|nr:MarR family transcriptional regulator [Novosphingobium aerophilum]MBC2651625.1 MarR family transcriptional regulator [Novosphingobium aerophilum]MBC2661463.1 MarR family transcriptional regulator [Novosphingobium aerophilum]
MKNPLQSYPGYLLRRAAISRLAELEKRIEPLGLSVTEASILALVEHNPGISQAECGRLLSIQRPNLNPIMRRLVERGLVVPSPGPGRVQHLALSPEGRDLTLRAIAEFEAHEQRIFDAVPAHLRDELVPLLIALWAPEPGP